MKKIFIFYLALIVITTGNVSAQTTIKIFDAVLYYDGYATLVTTPPPPAGILRLRNDLYSRKLTDPELASIGSTLRMNVTIKAACDNYDRIGYINIALVPKGQSTYNPDSVQHIELGRYITPFMDMNAQQKIVPYTYMVDNVTHLLKETSITANYDIWIELQLFGVPYAANTQIAGCSGRNDVFYGSLDFVTNEPAGIENTNVLFPLAFQEAFNNYKASATDTIGKTTLTFNVGLNSNLSDAALFLITSNHGANTDGEEYNRRNHFVYFDNNLVLTYKPGSATCEPLRKYNTQANGIYGPSPMTDVQWQSFSNWCPGDTIPIRRINLGPLTAGNHSFRVSVPDAVFNQGQGNIPLSLYLQGKTSGGLAINDMNVSNGVIAIYPNPANGIFILENVAPMSKMQSIIITNAVGMTVYRKDACNAHKEIIHLGKLAAGIYMVYVHTDKGMSVQRLQLFTN